MSRKRSGFSEGAKDEPQCTGAKKVKLVDLTGQDTFEMEIVPEINFVDMITNVDTNQKVQSDHETESVVKCVANIEQGVIKKNSVPVVKKAKMTKTKSTHSATAFRPGIFEAEKYFKEQPWWMNHDVPNEERCTIEDCSFEPVPHRIHSPPVATYSLIERKILVKYLIMRNKIPLASSKSVYKSMIQDGYLSHRSGEGMRSCFRRSIISEIGKYDLNSFHAHQFNNVRDLIEQRKKNVK